MSDVSQAAPAAPPIDVEKRVEQYIRLRDKIKEIKDRHDAELKPFNEGKSLLDAMLLDHLNKNNVKSMRTMAGTITASTRASCTVEDGEAFRAFVVNFGEWDLADLRANAPAVEKYLEDKQVLPPGVKVSRMATLGVRRSS